MIIYEFEKAKKLIDQSQNILLTTHERTDGDDLGSVLALAHHLKAVGKDVAIVIKGGVPESLRFLPMSAKVSEDLPDKKFDLLIVSGCSQPSRIGHEQILALKCPSISIDHHPDNKNFATINIVDAKKSAVAELVYTLFQEAGWPIDAAIATCLLTGIFTDTGSFMHSNTGPETLKAAGDLMQRGGRTNTIAKHTYRGKNIDSLKAWSKALDNAYYDASKKIIYSVMSEEDLALFEEVPSNVFEGFAETLNKVPEAKFAMFLKQDGELVKGSLRSEEHKGVDVSEVAHSLGGGGHKFASGFAVVGKLVKRDNHWQVE